MLGSIEFSPHNWIFPNFHNKYWYNPATKHGIDMEFGPETNDRKEIDKDKTFQQLHLDRKLWPHAV